MTHEPLTRRSGLEDCAFPQGASLRVKPCGFATRFILRGGPEVSAAVAARFGAAPPLRALASQTNGERAALWMGPDEWLLIAEAGADGLFVSLEASLAEIPHALFEVSHSRCALEISGKDAARVLNAGVNLDLDLAAFPTGMVVRTLLAKAEIMLWRVAPEQFRLETGRSFGPYVAAALMRFAQDWAAA